MNNNVRKSIAILLGGSGSAQLIGIISLPFLTRLYTPEDFTTLTAISAIIGLLSIVACLRLDVAIPLPEKDDEAIHLLLMSIGLTTTLSIITAIIISLIPYDTHKILGNQHLWLVPAGVFIASLYNSMQYWAIRKKEFSLISKARVSQAIAGASLQLAVGFLSYSAFGLTAGFIISNGAGFIIFYFFFHKKILHGLLSSNTKSIQKTLKKYKDFPRFSTLEALLNTAGVQLPLIIIATELASPEAAYLMLAMRIMQAPMGLIGSAIGQVYFSRAAQELRDGSIKSFTIETLNPLIKYGASTIIFIAIISTELLPLAFGSEWSRTGEIVLWIMPWLIIQFISSPISMIMHVANRQRPMMLLTAFGFATRVSAVTFTVLYYPEITSEIFSISGAIFYFVCFIIFTQTAEIRLGDAINLIRRNLITIATSATLAILIKNGISVIST